jgi:uncharacterized protein YjbI with pentapeptide repeats
MALRKIYLNELNGVLRLHQLWLNGSKGGVRADLRGTDLQYADLRGVNLRGANLQDANLQETDLQDANLQETDLRGANLQGAGLHRADLQGANLQDVDLQWVDFQGTDLRSTQFDQSIPHDCDIRDSKWLHSDLPWWLGHPDQDQIVLCDK